MKNVYLWWIVLLLFSLVLHSQTPSEVPGYQRGNDLTFTPPERINKKKQTRFREEYYGTINGKKMSLTFTEKLYRGQLHLVISLVDLKRNRKYQGAANVDANTYHLQEVALIDDNGNLEVIDDLYLHNYNPNFINLITGRGYAGCFSLKGEPYESKFPAKPFRDIVDFKGLYWGRIDGRPAEMNIEKIGEGYQITIDDKEQKNQYWTYLKELPEGNSRYALGDIYLKSVTSQKKMTIGNMVLDIKTTQIISGHFTIKGKEVGLFFVRKQPNDISLIPEFPWPPPEASDIVKIPDDFWQNIDNIGSINQLISNGLNQSGYQFRPNKYFYTPNGFALVTQLEQVDCDATPIEGDSRWNVGISEFEKDFSLLDYLRSLIPKEEALYRVFAFIVTDDLNPSRSIDPTMDEMQGWLIAGSAKLPNSIAEIPINENHYCHVYVYEFSKKDGAIQADMVKKGQEDCWRSGETHLKNTKILEHLVIRP